MIARLLVGFVFAAAAGSIFGQAPSSVTTLDVLLPADGNTIRVRLELSVAGFDPEAAWARFLDRWFDYFDRDGDGFLSHDEAARVIPLPSSAGGNISLDFARADLNNDGKLTRGEVQSSLRTDGFTPVVARVQPSEAQVQQLSDVLVRTLDRSSKGQLSRVDLERAAQLLRKFDDNEDELLTAAELLVGAPKSLELQKTGVRVLPAESKKPPENTLRLALSTESSPPSGGPIQRHSVAAALVSVDGRNIAWKGPAHATKQFCLAQFDNLRGDRPHLDRKQVEGDAGARLILALFDPADRDGDGRLTSGEFRRFLDILDEGATCQLVVAIADRGRNLFDAFDANGDGRLDFRELQGAPKRFETANPGNAINVPFSLHVTIQRGAAATAFGPLPLTAAPPSASLAVERFRKEPRWFQAMDHNQDGFVSSLEFVGPSQAFRQLDADGDGLISSEEADIAESRRSTAPKDKR